MSREARELLAAFGRLGPGEEAVLATVVQVDGSAYRHPGARMLLLPGGSHAGGISGGCLEKDLKGRAFGLTGRGPRVVAYDTRGTPQDPGGAFNTGCDGRVLVLLERLAGGAGGGAGGPEPLALAPLRAGPDAAGALVTVYANGGVGDRWTEPACARDRPHTARVFEEPWATGRPALALVEPLLPPRNLLVFGGGDDVPPLLELADAVGLRAEVIVSRPEEAARFGRRGRFLEPGAAVAALAPSARTAAVLFTHRFGDDERLLPALLASPCFYVGVLGPKKRAARLMTGLAAAGRLPDPATLDRLFAPAGLDLGGEGPAAVALSVLAQIEAVANGRDGGPLRARRGSIHAPEPGAAAGLGV